MKEILADRLSVGLLFLKITKIKLKALGLRISGLIYLYRNNGRLFTIRFGRTGYKQRQVQLRERRRLIRLKTAVTSQSSVDNVAVNTVFRDWTKLMSLRKAATFVPSVIPICIFNLFRWKGKNLNNNSSLQYANGQVSILPLTIFGFLKLRVTLRTLHAILE